MRSREADTRKTEAIAHKNYALARKTKSHTWNILLRMVHTLNILPSVANTMGPRRMTGGTMIDSRCGWLLHSYLVCHEVRMSLGTLAGSLPRMTCCLFAHRCWWLAMEVVGSCYGLHL